MAIKSTNTIGNPYHDEQTGEFTSGGVSSQRGSANSLSYIPKVNRDGTKREFFASMPNREKQDLYDAYNAKHGSEAQTISELKIKYDTSRNHTPERELKREQWLNDELQYQMQTPKQKGKKATVILGLPGSGKSTIAIPLMHKNGAFIIDADNFKNRIDDFKNDRMMVSAVHQESVDLSNRFRESLSDEGYNMVIGKVGGDYESIGYILDELTNKGYDIDVVLNDVPLKVAIDRTIGRYERKESHRLVPIGALLNADKNIFKTFDKALKHRGVSGGKLYSNDVEKGQSPTLLKEFKKGE